MKFNPRREIIQAIKIAKWKFSAGRKDAFKLIRSASSGYIANPAVRAHVFAVCENKCSFCGSSEKLHVDHIKSVKKMSKEYLEYSCDVCDINELIDLTIKCKHDFEILQKLNSLDNLQLLCSVCNIKKSEY